MFESKNKIWDFKKCTSVSSLLEEKHQKSTRLPFFIDQISQLEKKNEKMNQTWERIKCSNELIPKTEISCSTYIEHRTHLYSMRYAIFTAFAFTYQCFIISVCFVLFCFILLLYSWITLKCGNIGRSRAQSSRQCLRRSLFIWFVHHLCNVWMVWKTISNQKHLSFHSSFFLSRKCFFSQCSWR